MNIEQLILDNLRLWTQNITLKKELEHLRAPSTPKGAILSVEELLKLSGPAAIVLWKGYGRFSDGRAEKWVESVTLPPHFTVERDPFCNHPVVRLDPKKDRFLFLGDSNIGAHHNNHWLFYTEEDARAYNKAQMNGSK